MTFPDWSRIWSSASRDRVALAVLKTSALTVTGLPALTAWGFAVTLRTSAADGLIDTCADATFLTVDAPAVTSRLKNVVDWTVWLSVTLTDVDAPTASETEFSPSWTLTPFGNGPTETLRFSAALAVLVTGARESAPGPA